MILYVCISLMQMSFSCSIAAFWRLNSTDASVACALHMHFNKFKPSARAIFDTRILIYSCYLFSAVFYFFYRCLLFGCKDAPSFFLSRLSYASIEKHA